MRTPGICFPLAAYAGPVRRLLIFVIDLLFLIVVGSALSKANEVWFNGHMAGPAVLIWLGAALFYLIVVKARVGTLGMWLPRTRIVDLFGQPPSMWRMALRLFLCGWWWYSLFLIIDWAFIVQDLRGQTLRDKIAGTYIIRRDAHPTGKCPLVHYCHCVAGLVLTLPEVGSK